MSHSSIALAPEQQHWRRNLWVCVLGSFSTIVAMTLLLPFLPKKHTDQGLHGVGWEKGNFLNCVEQLPFFREEDIFSYSIHRKRSHQIKQIYIFYVFALLVMHCVSSE